METLPRLFQPYRLGDLEVRNRLWLSPMCQYSVEAQDGVPNDWHMVHYGSFALGGWGMVMAEATAVSPEGRISPWCLGLWNDEQTTAWRRINDFLHRYGATTAVQLGHAGRKASCTRWWPGVGHSNVPLEEGGWLPVGPTDVKAEGEGYTHPVTVLDDDAIRGIVDAFAQAAARCEAAGFDVAELHAAHGYLLHQFYSPLTNTRQDQWGGSFENRVRLTLEVVDAIKARWSGPLMVRISATDWVEGGWGEDDAVALCRLLKQHGVDLVDVSTAGNVNARIPVEPGYQVRFSEKVRREAGLPTSAVGMITEAEQAEQVLADGQADAVMVARQALRDPNWPLRVAHELGLPNEQAPWPLARWRGYWV